MRLKDKVAVILGGARGLAAPLRFVSPKRVPVLPSTTLIRLQGRRSNLKSNVLVADRFISTETLLRSEMFRR